MNTKVKDVLIRAGKTFWQSALAALAVAIPEIIKLIPNGWEALMPVLVSAGVGALAAGFSAMWNGVIAPAINKAKWNNGTAVIPTIDENGGDSSVEGK